MSYIEKNEKIEKKFFSFFRPRFSLATPPKPPYISALGVKIENRKRQPKSVIVMSIHAKFQTIWWSSFLWGFSRVEKSSPHVMIQGSL